MIKNYPGELWKDVRFDFEFTNQYRLEVSNFGRLRTYHKFSNGNELKGSMIKGYRIIRLKFFKQRNPKHQQALTSLQQQIVALNKELKLLQQNENKEGVTEVMQSLLDLKKKLARQFKIDAKSRTINYHSLVHKLVAEYFCVKPSELHTVVAHLDFNKLNNQSNNLRWMTPEENVAHQQKSPNVIAGRQQRKYADKSRVAKLTVTKVMLLKKLLNEGKPVRTLVKQFKVTDTQILRIKRGENWADIPAAK